MITPGFKSDPHAVRYVFISCQTCSKLRLDYVGLATPARRRWEALCTQKQQAFLEAKPREEHCTCLRLAATVEL